VEFSVHRECWPLAQPFVISRLTTTEAVTLRVSFTAGGHQGCGECEPHECDPALRNEVEMQVRAACAELSPEDSLKRLKQLLPLPTARNAVDCALWDLRAKASGIPVWQLAGLKRPGTLITALTIGIAAPEIMGARAREWSSCGYIKVKLADGDEIPRVEAVRKGAPDARITVDANEAWSFAQLREFAPHLARLGVALIEQPLPAGRDDDLVEYRCPVPICADEACDNLDSLERVIPRYQFVNIKLDKTGGLTEALMLAREARRRGLGVMTGCNVGTSLAMAPAFLVGQLSSFVDIDGPTMLVRDRSPGLTYDLRQGRVGPPPSALWG
jgi:L-Ala-D/L-Glu epimerase